MGGFTVKQSASAPGYTKKTLAANTSQQVVDPSRDLNGVRIINWTTTPVYLMPGTSGDPASGAPSDIIPAGAAGAPGQWRSDAAPSGGLRAIGASGGDLTVILW